MSELKSRYAEQLLNLHEPDQYAYFLRELGVDPNAANAALVDEAYVELQRLGYMEESATATVMPYYGAVARKPLKLTDAGIEAKNRLGA